MDLIFFIEIKMIIVELVLKLEGEVLFVFDDIDSKDQF